MNDDFLRQSPGVHHSWPLVVRGGLARTFGSLAGFLALLFLCVGLYLIRQALEAPLETGDAAVITAGVVIALAAVLIFFLIRQLTPSRDGARWQSRQEPSTPDSVQEAPNAAAAAREGHPRGTLAYQRFYVDRFRIRP